MLSLLCSNGDIPSEANGLGSVVSRGCYGFIDFLMLMRPDCIANVRDAFLAGRGVVTSFTNESWPHYLDAAVIMLDGHGYAEYGFLKREDYGEQ